MADYEKVVHVFEPVYNKDSKILILGTFPSVKSRENHFYYGHPQNRFWKLLAQLTGYPVPETVDEKKKMLLENGIAIWDVIASCKIIGSSDSSIKDVVPNDIGGLLEQTGIEKIYANGGKAYELYMKYIYPDTKREIIKLPSTSPANAAFGMERLKQEWGRVTFFDKMHNVKSAQI